MKILWAYELFHQELSTHQKVHKLIERMGGKADSVNVAYVVTQREPYLTTAFDVAPEKRFSTYPHELIVKELKKAKIGVKPKNITILRKDTASITESAQCLSQFAGKIKADAIALYTHGKKGWSKFLVGSFAETLMHNSKTDLLLINPKASISAKLNKAVIAFDFAKSSQVHLVRALKQCKAMDLSVAVVHVSEMAYNWSSMSRTATLEAEQKKIEKMSHWVLEQADKLDLDCYIQVRLDTAKLATSILNEVKRIKADLLIVPQSKNSKPSLMGGSVTRQLVRESSIPVWVMR